MTKKILIVKTSSMGDIVHALPAAEDILRAYPGTEIDWAVESAFADIPRMSRAIKRVIETNTRQWKKAPFSAQTWREAAKLRRTLKDAHYDLVIDLQGLIKSAVIARFAKAHIAGYDSVSIREPAASNFYTSVFHVSKRFHAVTRCRLLAALATGCEEFPQKPDFGISAEPFKAEAPYAVFVPNTSQERKLWAEEEWAALGRELIGRGLGIYLVWGSAKEKERAERLQGALGGASRVLPKMSLKELTSVLSGAKGAFGLDTGLMHLSAALGAPSVGIFTDTDAELAGLIGDRAATVGGKGARPLAGEVLQAYEGLVP